MFRSSRVLAAPVQWQPSFLDFEFDVGASAARASSVERLPLSHGAWIDQSHAAVGAPDALFEQILKTAPWSSHERPMYDRMVVEPRLTTRYWAEPPDALVELADVLSDRYAIDLRAINANFYRNGADSVAWHGDRIRHRGGETVVAILSLGGARRFLLRPRNAGPSIRLLPVSGDLLVMGGTCQRTWEHSVPKCSVAPPRISIMFREPGA